MSRALGLLLPLALVAPAPQAPARDAGEGIELMTQNQYLGTDLTPVIGAPDLPSFFAAAEAALEQVARNDFPARAERLAEEIAERLPAVVGLQEVYDYTFDLDGPGPLPPMNGPPPFADHLDETLGALADLGIGYVPLASVQNASISVPGIVVPGLGPVTVGVTDRDVILVRADLVPFAAPVPFSAACPRPSADGGPGCNYSTILQVPVPFPPGVLNLERGYVGVDVEVDGRLHRVVNTHLEQRRPDGTDASLNVQMFQAAELIQTLALFPDPLGANPVILGDINSGPEDRILPQPIQPNDFPEPFDEVIVPPYLQLGAAGYTDVWTLRPGASRGAGTVLGLSCCQDTDLANHQSAHYERIDVIFSAEVPAAVNGGRVLGSRVADKTSEESLWPSDHGAVAVGLQF